MADLLTYVWKRNNKPPTEYRYVSIVVDDARQYFMGLLKYFETEEYHVVNVLPLKGMAENSGFDLINQ